MGGLLRRKERWSLTWRGWLFTLAIAGLVFAFLFFRSYPFLAINEPVQADYLVVEAWIPSYALKAVTNEFLSKGYHRLCVPGVPMIPDGLNIDPGDTTSEHAGGLLRRLGIRPEVMDLVPAPAVGRDRTYSSAVALRKHAGAKGITLKSINLVTLGPHARRSRLLFEKAFKGQVRVGIISLENQQYDFRHWWQSSEGVKEVISEAVAYLYARVLFFPQDESSGHYAKTD